MKQLWFVAQREIRERRMVLTLAFVLGWIPVAMQLLPRPSDPAFVALILAVAMAFGVAVVMGGTVVASELADGRLAFYLSRPISSLALWGGKTLATVILAAASLLLTGLPGACVSAAKGSAGFGAGLGSFFDLGGASPLGALAKRSGGTALVSIGVVLALLLVAASAHAVSVSLQGRSWLSVADLALAIVLFLGLRRSWEALAATLAFDAIALWWVLLGGGLLATVLLAGLVQVGHGRSDLRRSHHSLSLCLAGGALTMVGLLSAYTAWVRRVPPSALLEVRQLRAPISGEWIGFEGPASGRLRRGYAPSFLLHLPSGRYLRLAKPTWLSLGPDGTGAWWIQYEGPSADGSPMDLWYADLTAETPRPVRSGIAFTELPGSLAISPDGSLLASIAGQQLLVQELSGGKLRSSLRLPEQLHNGSDPVFIPPGRLRLYAPQIGGREDTALDPTARVGGDVEDEPGAADTAATAREGVPSRRLRGHLTIGELSFGERPGTRLFRTPDLIFPGVASHRSADGHRLICWRGSEVRVLDGGTGAVLHTFITESATGVQHATMVADQVVAVVSTPGGNQLLRFAGGRADVQVMSFEGSPSIGPEVSPGRLLITVAGAPSSAFLLDVGAWRARPLELDFEPAQPDLPWVLPSPGGVESRLMRDRGGSLWLLDAEQLAASPVLILRQPGP